jgi:ATP-dependent RNA helicase SUPV3L1/SUV3
MMVEGEATQEPTTPTSATVSPPAEGPADQNAEASLVATAEPEPEPVEPAAAEPAPVESSAPPEDWSHLQAFQSVGPASESLAARVDYAEELTKELGARAARFARSVDESIVLSSEGLMRWLGDPVARVVAGDALLQPRAVLLADEALAAEDRAAVENRAGLWLAAHIRKVLGPLLALSEGGELPQAGHALGGKIAEALGVLEREKVRDDVRALDQTARGALRKLGVRFGALYIYVPLLLKPAPRSLCVLLWTLRRGAEAGADRLLAFAAAGRTSFANEGLLSPDAYRVAGFRLCGERVVRVDIIERLSDLIRAAIPDHLRAGSRPATPTYGFAVAPQMTSLTGCSGEAFASILRSLGFEPIKVSKAAFETARVKAPTEPLKPAVSDVVVEPSIGAAEETAGEPTSVGDEGAAAASDAEAPVLEAAEESVAAPDAEAAQVEEDVAAAPEADAPSADAEEAVAAPDAEAPYEAPTEEAVAAAPDAEAPHEDSVATAPEAEAPRGEAEENVADAAPAEGVATEPAADEEIEIWRPAPRRARVGRPAPNEEREASRHRGKPHRRHARPAEAPAAVEPPPPRPPRPERRDEAPRRFEAKEEGERRPQKAFGPRREQRSTPVDPDSPFAKLAALKPLLERRDKRP